MKTRQRVFETDSIDLASFLAAYGAHATIEQAPCGKRAIFTFSETPELLAAVIGYETGAMLPAKRLLNARSWLYREASNVVKRGGRNG